MAVKSSPETLPEAGGYAGLIWYVPVLLTVWLRSPAASTFQAWVICHVCRRPMLPNTRAAFSFRSRSAEVVRVAPFHGVARTPTRVLFEVARSPQVSSCAASTATDGVSFHSARAPTRVGKSALPLPQADWL